LNGDAIQVVTDTATAYPPLMPIEVEHSRVKSWLGLVGGLNTASVARVATTGHAFVQNFRHGYYELGIKAPTALQLVATSPFTELVVAI
jgi:hypothetical protein